MDTSTWQMYSNNVDEKSTISAKTVFPPVRVIKKYPDSVGRKRLLPSAEQNIPGIVVKKRFSSDVKSETKTDLSSISSDVQSCCKASKSSSIAITASETSHADSSSGSKTDYPTCNVAVNDTSLSAESAENK